MNFLEHLYLTEYNLLYIIFHSYCFLTNGAGNMTMFITLSHSSEAAVLRVFPAGQEKRTRRKAGVRGGTGTKFSPPPYPAAPAL